MWIFAADASTFAFTAAEFVPLVFVISSLGTGVQELLESFLTVTESR